jgi:hypothetical protein
MKRIMDAGGICEVITRYSIGRGIVLFPGRGREEEEERV